LAPTTGVEQQTEQEETLGGTINRLASEILVSKTTVCAMLYGIVITTFGLRDPKVWLSASIVKIQTK